MATSSVKEAGENTKNTAKLSKNSKLYKTVIKAILDKKGENVISLDLRKIHQASADFFIICEAATGTQIRAISDSIQTMVSDECGESPYRHEGYENLQWVIIDYVNIVIHIMLPDIRKYYLLEEMWSDGVEDSIKSE